KKYFVAQHVSTEFHKHAKERYVQKKANAAKKQSFVTDNLKRGKKKSEFNEDLCEMMVGADIPFHKLEHPLLRRFLEKYTSEHVPSESAIRKNYLSGVYQKVQGFIKCVNLNASCSENMTRAQIKVKYSNSKNHMSLAQIALKIVGHFFTDCRRP